MSFVRFLKEQENEGNIFESRVRKEFPDVYNKDVNFYGVLKKYADKDLDKYFVRFSNSWKDDKDQLVNKVGVKILGGWGNPRGVYAYWAEDVLKETHSKYAANFDTAFLIERIEFGEQILNIGKLSQKDYVRYVNKLEEFVINSDIFPKIKDHDSFVKFLKDTESDSHNKSYGGIFFYLIIRLSENSKHKFSEDDVFQTHMLRKVLGITFIGDKGYGIIHPNEPEQGLFLDPSAYKVIFSGPNKITGEMIDAKLYKGLDKDENGFWNTEGTVNLTKDFLDNQGNCKVKFGKVLNFNVKCDVKTSKNFPYEIKDSLTFYSDFRQEFFEYKRPVKYVGFIGCDKIKKMSFGDVNKITFMMCEELEDISFCCESCSGIIVSECERFKSFVNMPQCEYLTIKNCLSLESLSGFNCTSVLKVENCKELKTFGEMSLVKSEEINDVILKKLTLLNDLQAFPYDVKDEIRISECPMINPMKIDKENYTKETYKKLMKALGKDVVENFKILLKIKS